MQLRLFTAIVCKLKAMLEGFLMYNGVLVSLAGGVLGSDAARA